MPLEGEASERERREAVRIRSATEECEDELTEPSQYYEYGEDARRREEHHILVSFFLSLSTDILYNDRNID